VRPGFAGFTARAARLAGFFAGAGLALLSDARGFRFIAMNSSYIRSRK
jgi:hypothetical protein